MSARPFYTSASPNAVDCLEEPGAIFIDYTRQLTSGPPPDPPDSLTSGPPPDPPDSPTIQFFIAPQPWECPACHTIHRGDIEACRCKVQMWGFACTTH